MAADTITHADALVPSDALTPLADADHSDVLDTIVENVLDDRSIVVELEEWAFEDWSDVDMSFGERFMLVDSIEDYSDSAYFAEGATEISGDALAEGADEVDDGFLTDYISKYNDPEMDQLEAGETYLPKSAVVAIYVRE